jgi:hypothetical protein
MASMMKVRFGCEVVETCLDDTQSDGRTYTTNISDYIKNTNITNLSMNINDEYRKSLLKLTYVLHLDASVAVRTKVLN